MNGNELRDFDTSYGATHNNECPKCKTPTWMSERVHTTYRGKRYFSVEPESRAVGVNDLKGNVWCVGCWELKEIQND